MEIRLLNNEEIDKTMWDESLKSSSGSELYFQASYLDIVFPTWKALVAGEYQAIFPVFEKKILFWKSLRQPLYIGPYSVMGPNKYAIDKIKDYLPTFLNRYHWIAINLITPTPLGKTYQCNPKKYQQLIISTEGFIPDKSLRKNLKKASTSGLEKLVTVNSEDFLTGIQKYLLNTQKIQKSSAINLLSTIIKNTHLFGGVCLGIVNQKEEIQAAQFFITGKNRLYYVLSYSTEDGRKCSAMHALQTAIINNYLQRGGIVHFGGSNIEKIAEYNHNFNAEDISYVGVIKKKFPFNLN